jgi:hypothetical protein
LKYNMNKKLNIFSYQKKLNIFDLKTFDTLLTFI